ncbi:hypothetical protein PHLCEN_2v10330 [Hermanssonia centrifuga]|uniref:(4-O-methyl)-D-glucuronate--lignin esterase n=1 Tax=Hermanssonia centrifuga TaxID=98765 RepID=A0A2R6NP59_9APHY|nr:hypothetical protein PHLCEN_2v10330 [Hermanssonia centrifuga]
MYGITPLVLLYSLCVVYAAKLAALPEACPRLPNKLPAPTDLPIIDDLPNPFRFFNNVSLKSTADWACRKAELKILVQEYMYGYYPDHSRETVRTVRTNGTLVITVSVGGKSGSFNATLELPTSIDATPRRPVPVVISAGGQNDTVFLGSGVALVTFNVGDVAADSTTPGGAFWDLYSGEDIGGLLEFV